MAGVKGNQNAKGHGRKSAYRERADADFLWNNFIKGHTREEVEDILKKRHSIKDVWIAKALSGNERFISQIVHKLFPETAPETHFNLNIIPLLGGDSSEES